MSGVGERAVEEVQEPSASVTSWLSQHSSGTGFSGDHNSYVTSLKVFASKEPGIFIL